MSGLTPERVVRYHDGESWVYAIVSEASHKYITACVLRGQKVTLVKVPKEAERKFVDLGLDVTKACRAWLRPKNSLGIRREWTEEAKRFLRSAVPDQGAAGGAGAGAGAGP